MKTKIRFVSYRKFNELRNSNGVKEVEQGIIIGSTMYRLAGGDDWRKVDINYYCFRGSCDTANGFIFNDKTKEFVLVDPYLYDELVNNHKSALRVMESAFNSSELRGSFEKFEFSRNKASGMVLNMED